MRALLKPRLLGYLPLLATLVSAGLLGAIRENRIVTEVSWDRDYKTAIQASRQAHTPVLLSFATAGCSWCQKMEAETYSDPRVVKLAEGFRCVRVDGDAQPEIAARLGVVDYPTTIVIDGRGSVVSRVSGYQSPERLARVLTQASGH